MKAPMEIKVLVVLFVPTALNKIAIWKCHIVPLAYKLFSELKSVPSHFKKKV